MQYDVFGIGNPLMDIIVAIDDDELKSLNFEKGRMQLIEHEKMLEILNFLENKNFEETSAAGSCANTIRGIAKLGGKAVLTGKIGNDENGQNYNQMIEEEGVISAVKIGHGLTGTSIVFVTPDGERTMCTYLGRSRDFNSDDLETSMIKDSKYVYITAYMWDTESQKDASLKAIEIAKSSGAKIVFSLSDPNIVKRDKDDFLNLLNDIDILFCNSDEALELTGLGAEEAARMIGEKCSIAAITMGENGSIVCADGMIKKIDPFKTDAIDTTGAGDMYASGFLYGLSKGMDIEKSGMIGSFFASKIVSQMGTEISEQMIKEIRDKI